MGRKKLVLTEEQIAERKEAMRQYQHDYYQSHKAEHRELMREWYWKHQAECKAYQKAYRERKKGEQNGLTQSEV